MKGSYKLPPRFIEDCLECGSDVGDYAGGRLTADNAQLAELRGRAEHYAFDGVDMAPAGLKASARAVLAALDRVQS